MSQTKGSPKALEKPCDVASTKWKPIRMPGCCFLDPVMLELVRSSEKEGKSSEKKTSKLEPVRIQPSEYLDLESEALFTFKSDLPKKKVNGLPTKSNGGSLQTAANRKTTTSNPVLGKNAFGFKATRPSTSNLGNSTKPRQTTYNFNSLLQAKPADNNIRKKLFKSPTPRDRKPQSVTPVSINIISPTPPQQCNSNDDTVALLEMSTSETELVKNEPKKTPERPEPFTLLDGTAPSPKSEHSSGSSVTQFLQDEQMCRTPKQKTTTENSCVCNHCDFHIEKISGIIKKLTDLLEESKGVLEDLRKFEIKKSCGKRRSNGNKENLDSRNRSNSKGTVVASILTSNKKRKDLRIDTLKKNVTFGGVDERVKRGVDLRAINPMLGTPRVLTNANFDSPTVQFNAISRVVLDQCLSLQTPK